MLALQAEPLFAVKTSSTSKKLRKISPYTAVDSASTKEAKLPKLDGASRIARPDEGVT